MSTPINLNKARKARARADRKLNADRNAVSFGRSKSEKALDKAKKDKMDSNLDGHRRDT